MRIVVTGAGGLLGKKIVKVFSNYEVIGVYYSSKPETPNFLQLNLSDLKEIKKIGDLSPDVIIHAAALTDVDKCEKQPELARLLNVEVTKEIAKLSKETDSFLVYVSTDYVFDGEKGNYREDDKPNPINVYGRTKLEGEEMVKKYADKYLIVRTSTPYGSNPASGKDNFALWLLKKLKNREEIGVVTDQITSPTLNTNFALMLRESVERKLEGILHLTDASQISRFEFAITLAKVFGLSESLIKPVTSDLMRWLAKRPKNSSLNVSMASAILSQKPMTVEKALKLLKEEVESGG
ncbi:dTDP-4-dehydrorhamnose reductase [Sulfolobus tengchongensis]|uniref:dTDP-4-dehydrorhamnose reductase n=1 Tax=Sulfolobus tengchongensis TaxID=207809 RepID=A0AAX4KZ28_9CREN